MFSPTSPPREGGAVPEVYNVSIASPGVADAAIILPGQSEPTRKRYPYAIAGMQLAAGERALALKIAGTYVILGGAVGGGLPAGGDAGDVLTKLSAAAGDAGWGPLPFQVRPNLLDNWCFVGGGYTNSDAQEDDPQGNVDPPTTGPVGLYPINQREQLVYIASSSVNTVDRWRLSNAIMTVQADGLQIVTSGTSELIQRMDLEYESLAGKTVTVSALADGELITATGTVPAAKPGGATVIAAKTEGSKTLQFSFSSATKYLYVNMRVSSGVTYKVQAFKLEVGDSQTLAYRVGGAWALSAVPDYAEQLQVCRRYFYRLKPRGVQAFANGFYASATNVQLAGSLGVPFRRTADHQLWGTLYVASPGHYGGNALAVKTVGDIKLFTNGALGGNVNIDPDQTGASTISAGDPAILQIRDAQTYLDFSAEL